MDAKAEVPVQDRLPPYTWQLGAFLKSQLENARGELSLTMGPVEWPCRFRERTWMLKLSCLENGLCRTEIRLGSHLTGVGGQANTFSEADKYAIGALQEQCERQNPPAEDTLALVPPSATRLEENPMPKTSAFSAGLPGGPDWKNKPWFRANGVNIHDELEKRLKKAGVDVRMATSWLATAVDLVHLPMGTTHAVGRWRLKQGTSNNGHWWQIRDNQKDFCWLRQGASYWSAFWNAVEAVGKNSDSRREFSDGEITETIKRDCKRATGTNRLTPGAKHMLEVAGTNLDIAADWMKCAAGMYPIAVDTGGRKSSAGSWKLQAWPSDGQWYFRIERPQGPSVVATHRSYWAAFWGAAVKVGKASQPKVDPSSDSESSRLPPDTRAKMEAAGVNVEVATKWRNCAREMGPGHREGTAAGWKLRTWQQRPNYWTFEISRETGDGWRSCVERPSFWAAFWDCVKDVGKASQIFTGVDLATGPDRTVAVTMTVDKAAGDPVAVQDIAEAPATCPKERPRCRDQWLITEIQQLARRLWARWENDGKGRTWPQHSLTTPESPWKLSVSRGDCGWSVVLTHQRTRKQVTVIHHDFQPAVEAVLGALSEAYPEHLQPRVLARAREDIAEAPAARRQTYNMPGRDTRNIDPEVVMDMFLDKLERKPKPPSAPLSPDQAVSLAKVFVAEFGEMQPCPVGQETMQTRRVGGADGPYRVKLCVYEQGSVMAAVVCKNDELCRVNTHVPRGGKQDDAIAFATESAVMQAVQKLSEGYEPSCPPAVVNSMVWREHPQPRAETPLEYWPASDHGGYEWLG